MCGGGSLIADSKADMAFAHDNAQELISSPELEFFLKSIQSDNDHECYQYSH